MRFGCVFVVLRSKNAFLEFGHVLIGTVDDAMRKEAVSMYLSEHQPDHVQ